MKIFFGIILGLLAFLGLIFGFFGLMLSDSSPNPHPGGAINSMFFVIGVGGIMVAFIFSVGVWLLNKPTNKKDNTEKKGTNPISSIISDVFSDKK